jgi:hypothetical protein
MLLAIDVPKAIHGYMHKGQDRAIVCVYLEQYTFWMFAID